MTFVVGFPTGRDKGTEVPSLSRDRGTTGQAKNLAKGQPKFGTGQAGTSKIWDAGQNGTELKRTF